jgi:drug/metabolite transporter (DMT)-like permease
VRQTEVKIRSPWGVFGLTLVTLGVYFIFWYYRINRELNAFGRTFSASNPLRVRPGVALLAVTLGGILIVPWLVSSYRTFKRIRRAQELAGVPDLMSPGLAFALFLLGAILFPVEMVYAQKHLNRVWQHVVSEEEKLLMGLRGVAQDVDFARAR